METHTDTSVDDYSGQKKETFRPETAKIIFSNDLGQIFFAPMYYGLSFNQMCQAVQF